MSVMTDWIDRLGVRDVDRLLGLRPPYPPVAVQLDRESLTLVRLKPRRAKRPLLEAVQVRPLDPGCVPLSIFHNGVTSPVDLAARMRSLFELSGTRPGRVSLVVPDNLAKISLVTLPERPASSRQMDELVRAQMRRAIPFRVEDARISYQVLPAAGSKVVVLVILMRRALVEQYERALESAGARVGLVDLSTTNLINLCRARIARAAGEAGDVALLNCEPHYFSLAIMRDQQLIFFRCKTYAEADRGPENATLAREVSNSLSYYQEKLAGTGLGTLLVRSVAVPIEESLAQLSGVEIARVEPVNPAESVTLPDGAVLDAEQAQRIAPVIGAAAGEALMQRLDLNLSTRPFRNNTLIWTGYGVALALLVSFAAWNGVTFYSHVKLLDEKKSHLQDLAAQQADLDARESAAEAERKRRELALDTLTVQALKANEVIEWKAFSWTELFNRLETALPWNVYLSAVRPVFRAERAGDVQAGPSDVRSRPVAVEGYAKSLNALLEFERQLFASEYFDDPEPLRHAPDERGDLVFTMRFMYFPDGRPRRTVIESDEGAGDDAAAEVADNAAGAAEPAADVAADRQAEPEQDADADDTIGVAEPPTIQRASEKASSKKPATREVRP